MLKQGELTQSGRVSARQAGSYRFKSDTPHNKIRKSLLIETIYIELYRIGCHRPNYERRCESEKNLYKETKEKDSSENL